MIRAGIVDLAIKPLTDCLKATGLHDRLQTVELCQAFAAFSDFDIFGRHLVLGIGIQGRKRSVQKCIQIDAGLLGADGQPQPGGAGRIAGKRFAVNPVLDGIGNRRVVAVVGYLIEQRVHAPDFILCERLRRHQAHTGKLLRRDGKHFAYGPLFGLGERYEQMVAAKRKGEHQQHAYGYAPKRSAAQKQDQKPSAQCIDHVVAQKTREHAAQNLKGAMSARQAAKAQLFHA